jgi:hypothetical protein
MHLRLLAPVAAAVLAASCTSVKYQEFHCVDYSPRSRAVVIEDPVGQQVVALGSEMKLPHLSPRERCVKEIELYGLLTRRLGSPDYVMIGSISAKGAEGQSSGKVLVTMLERAAKEGGDVVLMMESGVNRWTTVHQTPGKSSTTAYGAAAYENNMAYGAARSDTVYTPGTTYSRAHSSAWGGGVVLRHAPGRGKLRQSLLELPDEAIQEYLNFIASMQASEITSEECDAEVAQFIRHLHASYKSAAQ